MRMWHKELIHVLPRQQLVAQWRELSLIASNIKLRNTPNHILVNKVMDYPIDHFITYTELIRHEMTSRGYRTMDSVWNKITSLAIGPDNSWYIVDFDDLYSNWMDNTYLTICYWNLYEKYNCGGITEEEWIKIDNEFYIIGSCPFTSCL